MYKNWKTICECENPVLRLLVAVVDDPKILAGFERGFPEFFTNEKQADVRIPLSALRHAYEHNTDEDDTLNFVCEKLGIPMWGFGDQPEDGDISTVPEEWLALEGLFRTKTIAHVTYANEDCIVLVNSMEGSFCMITPAKFLDLNA